MLPDEPCQDNSENMNKFLHNDTKNEENTNLSTRKGRFLIKNVKTDMFSSIKRRRFSIYHPEVSIEYKLIFEIIEKQNEQIETLFDMINNITGNDKLFHKEFLNSSNEVYEKIGRLKSLFSNFGSG